MEINQLKEYREHLALLGEKEKKLADEHLMKFYHEGMQGPLTGLPSLDKPWFSRKKQEINMPDVNQSAYRFLYECNKNNLDSIALIYDPILEEKPTNITYGELFRRIDETAEAYVAYGIRKGDIVTVSLPSFVEDIVNFYALNKIGAVANQIHPLASQEEIEFYLNEAESKVFVGYGDVYEKIKKIKCATLKHVILVSPKDSISKEVKLNIFKKTIAKDVAAGIKMLSEKDNYKGTICVSWKEFIKKGESVEDIYKYINHDANSLATLSHTSGTSGKSKAVMTSSKAFNASVVSILRETNLFQKGDKELLVLPPFPLYILNNAVHLPLCVGEQIIVIPKVEYNKLSLYFKKHSPQHIKGIPSTAESMLKDEGFNGVDLSDFKLLISGGGKLTCEKEINQFLKEHNCPNGIANGYGMSEGGGAITCMFNDTVEKGTVGRPLMKCMAKAVSLDEEKRELSYLDEEDGEIYLTGPAVMDGYYKNVEATEELFQRDEDGTIWLKTGDLGRITKEGNVKIVGRLKRTTFVFDIENNTASKVSHDYMETILCQNVGVEDAVVVAVPDEKSRHAFKAYITLRDQAYDEIISDLDKTCKVTLRKYISPVEYIIVDKIPKNAAGKNDYKYLESYESDPEVRKKSLIKVLHRKEISER